MRPAYVRVRPPEAGRGEKIYRADETKISSKLLTTNLGRARRGRRTKRERKKEKSRISNSTPKAEFLNERGANNARVFASSHLRLNEKEREGKATRIWVSGTWSAREYKRQVEIITTNATRERILVAAKMAMVAKENAGERERKDGGMARYF